MPPTSDSLIIPIALAPASHFVRNRALQFMASQNTKGISRWLVHLTSPRGVRDCCTQLPIADASLA